MAVSNRDRVGRGLDILAAGLRPVRRRGDEPGAPGRAGLGGGTEGWEHSAAADVQYSRSDPRFLLKVITENERAFRDWLSRAEQAFASEMRETGNKWAHGDAFSARDTYRALDTMERLLTAADAGGEAEEVRKLRLDAQQRRVRGRDPAGGQVVGRRGGAGAQAVARGDRAASDVRSGNFNASEFAADLYRSRTERAAREYTDPVEFFRRTYLTDGLKDLMPRAARRIGGDMNASPVVNLQTNFGGGKTHSMLALWHLLSGTALPSIRRTCRSCWRAATSARLAARRGGWPWSATTSRPGRAQSRRRGRRTRRR